MTDSIDKSFRIKESGLRALDGLRDYFVDVNRSDICAAAIRFFSESGGRASATGVADEPRPFDFCREPVRDVLNRSYQAGNTAAALRICCGGSEVDIPQHSSIKCHGLSGVAFHLTSRTYIILDLACDYHARLTSEGGRDWLIIYLLKEDEAVDQKEKGREANDMGRYLAERISAALGTELEKKSSNECVYNGEHCVIKSARRGNHLFGITKRMHNRLDTVLLAVETAPDDFDVYAIPMDILENECINTGENSGGGKVVSYHVDHAISLGNKIARVAVDRSF